MNIQEILTKIRQSPIGKRPILIGIDGFGGGGKSTFADKLKSGLENACVVRFDDFMTGLDSDADKSNFDRARLELDVLQPFRDRKPIQYRRSALEGKNAGDLIKVPDVYYVIVEGVSCYHPTIEKYYDFKIWVQVKADDARKRGMHRDIQLGRPGDNLAGGEKFWDMWTKTYQQYKDKYHPDSRADLVYDNSKDSKLVTS